MSLSRRSLIGALLAAPAIIRTPGLIMPVSTRALFKDWRIGLPTVRIEGTTIYLSAGVFASDRMVRLIADGLVINEIRFEDALRGVTGIVGAGRGQTVITNFYGPLPA